MFIYLISSDAAVTASSSLSITLVNTEHCMLHCNEYYWECSEGGHWHWLKPQMHRSQLPLHLSLLIRSAQFAQFAILCTSCTTNVQCHNSLHNLYNQCTYCKELCIGLHDVTRWVPLYCTQPPFHLYLSWFALHNLHNECTLIKISAQCAYCIMQHNSLMWSVLFCSIRLHQKKMLQLIIGDKYFSR